MANIGTGLGNNIYEDILFVNDDDTRLGINVENPVCTLDVDGDIKANKIEASHVKSTFIECNDLMAVEKVMTDAVHIWDNVKVLDINYPFEEEDGVDAEGNVIYKVVERKITKALFINFVHDVLGRSTIEPMIDYKTWIINGPSSENLPDKEDMEGWWALIEEILKYAGIFGTIFGLANLLSAGAAGEALSSAAQSVLCGLKSILGLGSCGPDGGEDGDDGADGDSPDLGSIYLPVSRITDSGLIYFRDLDSIPFLNPFNPNDPTNYYSVSTDMGIRNNLFFKTTKRVYLTHESCFENIQKNRERNRATISSTMRWELFSFPERKMCIETISFDSFSRTDNPLVFDEGSYSDYSQTSKMKIDKAGIHKVVASNDLTLLDVDQQALKNIKKINCVSNGIDPILMVDNIVLIDKDGFVPASRIIDDNLISLVDGEVNLSNRTARFTNEVVQNYTDALMEIMNTDVQMYTSPVFDPLLPIPEPWTLFDTSIELPNVNVPLRAVVDSWVSF